MSREVEGVTKMTIRLIARGPYACFTRPELSVERYSYDAMTPSAAVGLIEAVHWKPAIRWVVDRITVLNPIRHVSIKRNEVARRASPDRPGLDIGSARMQRQSIVLRDVAYLIEAHAEATGRASERDREEGVSVTAKHEAILMRRVEAGQHHHMPVLGCREWPAEIEPVTDQVRSELSGERDLGIMLHSIDHEAGRRRRWFRAVLRDGVMTVPHPTSIEVMA